MVVPIATNIARLVGRATPAALKIITATCAAVERDSIGGRAEQAIVALRTACDVREQKRRRRK